MIEQQVRPWDVLNARVLEALSSVARENFVPMVYRRLAFADLELPLGKGEMMLKPVVEGRLLQAVVPTREDRVLEIGSGSGFLTACLAHLAGEVVGIEQHADFVDAARARLAEANVHNAHIDCADAVNDYKPDQPFDVMVVTGAVAALPARWLGWVKPGGRLLAIVGASPVQRAVLYSCDSEGQWRDEALFETDVRYLRNAAPVSMFSL